MADLTGHSYIPSAARPAEPAPSGAVSVVLAIWALLIGAALLQNLFDLSSESRVWILDVNMERSIYTWFSQCLLAGAAVLLANIGTAQLQKAGKLAAPFLILAVLVFAMSIDESLSLHEKLSSKISAAYHPTGWLTYVWVVPVGALCLVMLVAFLPFLNRLDPITRNRMLVAAAVFVTGALGCEMIESKLVSAPGASETDYLFRLITVVEEAMEGLAVILLIAALLDYRRRHRIVF